jgi:hypothetical protein
MEFLHTLFKPLSFFVVASFEAAEKEMILLLRAVQKRTSAAKAVSFSRHFRHG